MENCNLGQLPVYLKSCPHCGIANPLLQLVWQSPDHHRERPDGEPHQAWVAFECSTCFGVITGKSEPGYVGIMAPLETIYPGAWVPEDVIPTRTQNYLSQAHKTLNAPDASVIMSASSIDSILKDKGLREGSLYKRINEAVKEGLITTSMSDWAHLVRLDANSPRHADEGDEHMTRQDAERAFNFAKALAEIIYVLPSKIPNDENDAEG